MFCLFVCLFLGSLFQASYNALESYQVGQPLPSPESILSCVQNMEDMSETDDVVIEEVIEVLCYIFDAVFSIISHELSSFSTPF